MRGPPAWAQDLMRSALVWWETQGHIAPSPALTWRRSARRLHHSSGSAFQADRIVVTVGRREPRWSQKATLLHEIAHTLAPPTSAHGVTFYLIAWRLYRWARLPLRKVGARELLYRASASRAAQRATTPPPLAPGRQEERQQGRLTLMTIRAAQATIAKATTEHQPQKEVEPAMTSGDKLRALETREGFVPNVRCHSCGQDILLDLNTYFNYSGNVTCEHCKMPQNVVIEKGGLISSTKAVDEKVREALRGALNANVPVAVVLDLIEAYRDHQDSCWKSCAVMCRRTVQRSLLNKHVPDDTPKNMIVWAEQHGILNRKLRALGETVTFFGNSGAHPQDTDLDEVGNLEATQGLLVTKEIVANLFPPPPPSPTPPPLPPPVRPGQPTGLRPSG